PMTITLIDDAGKEHDYETAFVPRVGEHVQMTDRTFVVKGVMHVLNPKGELQPRVHVERIEAEREPEYQMFAVGPRR
ncbi:MAG TPA: hypothetical protein VHB78_04580, partial [Vicinamibacterales bacterium]|nr:hypothetical protein [Vicinamibacterales bacterium]